MDTDEGSGRRVLRVSGRAQWRGCERETEGCRHVSSVIRGTWGSHSPPASAVLPRSDLSPNSIESWVYSQ